MSGIVVGAAGLLFLNAYAAVLVVLRGRLWPVPVYRPMLLNIALSFLPVLLALLLPAGLLAVAAVAGTGAVPGAVLVGSLWLFLLVTTGVWLLAFPNSAYLITEPQPEPPPR